jgi:hypothetical protein
MKRERTDSGTPVRLLMAYRVTPALFAAFIARRTTSVNVARLTLPTYER